VLFDKGSILYGFDLARAHIQRAGRVVLVEGYMDVVVAHQAGQRDVVGTSGTALTDRHADLLKRIAKTIILCLDPDVAGDTAALKGSEVLQEHADKISVPVMGQRGLMGVERRSETEIRVMQLPRGLDPDELLLAEGGQARWEELREKALPLVEHVISVIASKHDLSTARGKSEAVAEVAQYVREVGDPVQRAHYAQRVASVLRVPEEAVLEVIGTRSSSGAGRSRRPVQSAATGERQHAAGLPGPVDPQGAPEEHLLSLVLNYPQVTWMVHAPLPEDFTRQENRLVYEVVAAAAGKSDKASVVPEGIRQAAAEEMDSVLATYMERIAAREEPELFRFALPYEVENRLKRLRQHNDRMWLDQCRLMIRDAEETGDTETANKLRLLSSRSLSRYQYYNPKPSTVFRDSRD
jgi:DNA primase